MSLSTMFRRVTFGFIVLVLSLINNTTSQSLNDDDTAPQVSKFLDDQTSPLIFVFKDDPEYNFRWKIHNSKPS